MYTVQVRFDGNDVASRMREIRDWLAQRDLEPSASQYRMDADGVLCRVDFSAPSEAAAFAETFAESVVG